MNRININGVTIETNKSGLSVNGTFVRFGDGSTYNTATRAFRNAGPGYVTVNGRPLTDDDASYDVEPPLVTTRTEEFPASRLSLKTTTVPVTVVNGEGSTMRVEVTGTEDMVAQVLLEQRGDTLIVQDNGVGGFSSNGMTFIGNGSVMTSSFGSISIGGISIDGGSFGGASIGGLNVDGDSMSFSNDVAATGIKVFVPFQTPISVVSSGTGNVEIDGIDGPLDIKVSGAANVHSSGASTMVVAVISGSGHIDIDTGNVETIDARVSGVGNVQFRGTATNADLKVSGVGNIYVAHVINPPIKRVTGIGKIRVKQVGQVG